MDGISGIGSSDKKIGQSSSQTQGAGQTQGANATQGVDGGQQTGETSTGSAQQANKAFGSKDI